MLNFVICEEPINTTSTSSIGNFIHNIKDSDLLKDVTKKLSNEFEAIKNKFENTFLSTSDGINGLLNNETKIENYKPSEITNNSTNLNKTEANISKLVNETSSLLNFF